MAITLELLARLFMIFFDGEGPDPSAKAIYVHLTKRICIQVLNLMKQEKMRRAQDCTPFAFCSTCWLVTEESTLFSRFNSRTVVELKRELLGWLRHLQDGRVASILCEIVSVLAAQMLPVGKWPELEGFLTRYIQKTEHVAMGSTLLNLLDELA